MNRLKRRFHLVCAMGAGIVFAACTSVQAQIQDSGQQTAITVRVTDQVLMPDAARLGLNLGETEPFGASWLLKNLVPNPGFESGVFGTVVHVDAGLGPGRFAQAFWDATWTRDHTGTGQPNGFWNGGRFEIADGAAKGRAGTIKEFRIEGSKNTFSLDQKDLTLERGDVLFITTELSGVHSGRSMDTTRADTQDIRPGSPGSQSLVITGGSDPRSGFRTFMDTAGDRESGGFFRVRGSWALRFWAKAGATGTSVSVRFARTGTPPFLDQKIELGTEWREYTLEFKVADQLDDPSRVHSNGKSFPLTLSVNAQSPAARVWLDDMDLSRTDQKNPTAFSDDVVDRLLELRPGVLRFWATQFGESLDNQLTVPWARKTHAFAPRDRVASHYSYSLHEFLELCHYISAEPWYVIPPTFSDTELRNLVAYLAGEESGGHPYAARRASLGRERPWTESFTKIHLEFGNELWGSGEPRDPFFGASLRGGERLGRIAGERLGIIRKSPEFNAKRFDLIIGGQLAVPEVQRNIAQRSKNHDSIALAPYFGRVEEFGNRESIYRPILTMPLDDVRGGRVAASVDAIRSTGSSSALAIYEINFGLVRGGAPLELRNDIVTGAVGALLLPLHMLTYAKHFGARSQCAFTMAQYSYRASEEEIVKVWGLLRDINVNGRKRPTWLGLELVNRAISDNMVATTHDSKGIVWEQAAINGLRSAQSMPALQSFAFRGENSIGLILFNLDLDSNCAVRLDVPAPEGWVATLHQIATDSLSDDNEDSENVSIKSQRLDNFSAADTLSLPAHSLSAVVWKLENEGQP